MSNKEFNISDMLDFSDIDLTAPDKVIDEYLTILSEQTHNIICGRISIYDGPVTSYTTRRMELIGALEDITKGKHVDIQDSLGKIGEKDKYFECYLYTSNFTNYRYRLFFMKYGIANYPVQFTLEESIAKSIQGTDHNYIVTCNNREEVEALIIKILKSRKVLNVMQELIRINQVKKTEEPVEDEVVSADVE